MVKKTEPSENDLGHTDALKKLWSLASRYNKTELRLVVRFLGKYLFHLLFDERIVEFRFYLRGSVEDAFKTSNEIVIAQNSFDAYVGDRKVAIDMRLSHLLLRCASLAAANLRKTHQPYKPPLKVIEKHENYWETMASAYQDHVTRHGVTAIPAHGEWLRLNQWLNSQRVAYHRKELLPSRILRLEQIGIDWHAGLTRNNERWDQMFRLYGQYRLEQGDAKLTATTMFNGERLGSWVLRQRRAHSEGRLNSDRTARLESAGIDWTTSTQR